MFEAKGELLTNALKAKAQMDKSSLYDVIRLQRCFSDRICVL